MTRSNAKTRTRKSKPVAFPELSLETLTAVTGDPADAMRLAVDLFSISAHRVNEVLSHAAGSPPPAEPRLLSNTMRELQAFVAKMGNSSRGEDPPSNAMRELQTFVTARLNAIAGRFTMEELARLMRIGREILKQLERPDAVLGDQIVGLVLMDADTAAAWIRAHLDELEARFAS